LSQRGWDCQVLCGEIESEAGLPANVEVIRSTQLIKSSDWRRLWTWLRFTRHAISASLKDRNRAVLVVTNPPFTMLAMAVLRRLVGVRFALLVHDLYPDVAERMNVIRPNGPIARLWRAMSRTVLTGAATVVTIGELMARLLRMHLREHDKINLHVIPTWVNTDFIRPVNKSTNPFLQSQHLQGKFIVMYSGAFGATHHLETYIDAAALLTDEKNIHFVLIGGGTSARDIQQMLARRPLSNVTMLGFQPWESVPYSLGAADCSVVSLDSAYGGVSVPSKAYYALAAGSALLAVCPDDSELSALVRRYECGVQVRPHDAQALGDAVRALHRDPERLAKLQRNARRTAEQHFSFVQLDRLCDELTTALGSPRKRQARAANRVS
jgi:glycosyltransferase involved in cell wall biosynthesis